MEMTSANHATQNAQTAAAGGEHGERGLHVARQKPNSYFKEKQINKNFYL